MRKKTLIIFFSTGLVLLLSFVRKYSFEWSFIFSFVAFFLLTIFLFRGEKRNINDRNKKYLVLILLPPVLFNGLIHILNFKATLISLPSSIAPLIGIVAAYFFIKEKSAFRIISSVVVAFLLVWIKIDGYEKYSQSISNYVHYNSISGKISEKIQKLPTLKDVNDNPIDLSKSSEFVVLDFWNIYCAPCYKQFPDFEDYARKYKEDMRFYAVNVPMKNESFELRRNSVNEFDFPKLFATSTEVAEMLGVNVYPTVVVIKDNMVVYRGNFKGFLQFHSDLNKKIN